MNAANPPISVLQFQSEVNSRLDAFELKLMSLGILDAPARRQSVESEFNSLTTDMDEFELKGSLPALAQIVQRVLGSFEFHDVRVHKFSDGQTQERCIKCRYGHGHLSEGISVRRELHVFNKHLKFTRRHQVTPGKELIVIKHAAQSTGPASKPTCIFSQELGEIISAGEYQLAIKATTAQTQAERESALQALAEVSITQDVGTRRGEREMLVSPKAFDRAVTKWSAYAAGIQKPTAPNSDHRAKLLERETAQQGYAEDGTVAAWEYMLKVHGSLVCDEWKQFPLFVADMGAKPSTAHILCRFKNRGLFNKANIRWMTRKQARVEGLGILSAG
jgi:hypothetical protein